MDKILEKFSNIKTDYSLAPLTTFKIGGPAKYFLETDDENYLQRVIKFCAQNDINFKVIGGGSNLLISDRGYNGLVIKFINQEINCQDNVFILGAGIILMNFVNFSLEKGFAGQEFLAGIPGTIGGAIYGNAGAYGQDMGTIIESVKVLNNNYEFESLEKSQCHFRYRKSIFSNNHNIILSAKLVLAQGDIQASQELVQQRIINRAQGHPLNMPNAGSWFKNIDLKNEIKEKIKEMNLATEEEMSRFEKYQKVPAAFLIEKAGLKGHQLGGAQMSEKHANFLVNKKNATAKDIVKLSDYIKEKIKEKYGVELTEEVQYVGF